MANSLVRNIRWDGIWNSSCKSIPVWEANYKLNSDYPHAVSQSNKQFDKAIQWKLLGVKDLLIKNLHHSDIWGWQCITQPTGKPANLKGVTQLYWKLQVSFLPVMMYFQLQPLLHHQHWQIDRSSLQEEKKAELTTQGFSQCNVKPSDNSASDQIWLSSYGSVHSLTKSVTSKCGNVSYKIFSQRTDV